MLEFGIARRSTFNINVRCAAVSKAPRDHWRFVSARDHRPWSLEGRGVVHRGTCEIRPSLGSLRQSVPARERTRDAVLPVGIIIAVSVRNPRVQMTR